MPRTQLPCACLTICETCDSCRVAVPPVERAWIEEEDGSVWSDPVLCAVCTERERIEVITIQRRASALAYFARASWGDPVSAEYFQNLSRDMYWRVRMYLKAN
jgi:hypothetical protein